jgi:hypothetical protein
MVKIKYLTDREAVKQDGSPCQRIKAVNYLDNIILQISNLAIYPILHV